MVQGLLLEDGIPSMLKRTRGFDDPDFLAAGPRDILVSQTGAEEARGCSRGPSSTESEAEERGRRSKARHACARPAAKPIAAVWRSGSARPHRRPP